MRTAKTAWIWVIILALCVSVGWTQEPSGDIKAESQKKAVPATRQASCIVKITADPAVLPLTIDNVMYLIHSSGVGGRAIAEMLGEDRPAPDEVIGVEELIGPDDDRPRGYGGGGGGGYGGGGGSGYGGGYGGGGGGYGGYGMSGLGAEDTRAGASAVVPTAAASGGTSDSRRTTRTTSSSRRTTSTGAPATSSASRPLPRTASSSSRYSTTSRPTAAGVRVPTAARSRTPSTTSTRSTTSTYGRYTRQPGYARASTTTSASRDQNQALFFQLNVGFGDYGDDSADAQVMMLTIVDYLRDALHNAFRDQGRSLESQIQLADLEVNQAEMQLVRLQDHLRNISGSQDLSRQVILSDIRRVRNELESAKMQQAADEATAEALMNQIEQSRRKLAEKLATDEIMQELKHIVEINKEKVKYAEATYRQKADTRRVEVSKASEESARARIELAKRAEEISKSVAGGQEDEWNNILANLSVDMAQNAARVAGLEPQMKRAEDLLERADRYEVESLKLGLAKRNLEEAILWQSQMSRKVRVMAPPTVIMIGAE